MKTPQNLFFVILIIAVVFLIVQLDNLRFKIDALEQQVEVQGTALTLTMHQVLLFEMKQRYSQNEPDVPDSSISQEKAPFPDFSP